MSLAPEQLDRVSGVLLTQACGDALGVPYEFGRPPGPDELAVMTGGGLGDYAPGEWSDDTQMAVCIARVCATGADLTSAEALDSIARGFLEWHASNPADIGVQTNAVLKAASGASGPPGQAAAEAAREYAVRNPHSAGNGALMRTSVVGISALHDRNQTAASARAVAELTHADPLAGDSCVLWSEAIRIAVLEGVFDVASGLELLPAERRNDWAGWIAEVAGKPSLSFAPNGFTVTALQAAWAAITETPIDETSPERHLADCLHAAVRIGNDTDTVAAVAGGLLGARWGRSAVPEEWARLVHGWPGLHGEDLVRLSEQVVT